MSIAQLLHYFINFSGSNLPLPISLQPFRLTIGTIMHHKSPVAKSQRLLSNSTSNTNYDRAAIVPFDAFLATKDLPSIYNLTIKDIEDESIHILFVDYIEYLLQNPLQNRSSGEIKPVAASTALGYFRRVHVILSSLFQQHPYLKEPDVESSACWKNVQDTFMAAYGRKQHFDDEVMDTSLYPLYRKLEPYIDSVTTDKQQYPNVSNLDLEYIQRKMFINGGRDNFSKLAYNAATFHADVCGGEVAFLRISELRFDPLLKVAVAAWREGKTLMKYAMTFVHNKYEPMAYLTDFYFLCFATVS